jgi:hypothetical protein
MPDARVQAAIDHWAPRFIAMGVDYNDFVRTTARIERWAQWLDGWSELAEEHLELAREAERAGRDRSAGGDRQRGGRRAGWRCAGPAVHGREAVARAAGVG